MKVFWRVWCPRCEHSGTNALPPDHLDFSKVVNCVTCNRVLDASKGKLDIKPTRIRKRPEVDLLEVS